MCTRSHITGARSSISPPASTTACARSIAASAPPLAPGVAWRCRPARQSRFATPIDRKRYWSAYASSLVSRPPPIAPAAPRPVRTASAIALCQSANASSQPICTKPPSLRRSGCVTPIGRCVEADVVAPAIAEPAVGDRVILLDRHRAQQRAVADVGKLPAPDGALRAARLRAVQIPRPRLEAIGFRRERPDRTEFGDVAREIVPVRPVGRRRDDVVRAAILDDELPFVGDHVVEANAPLADDATFFVEHDRRPQVDRLRLARLRIDDVRIAARVRHRVILEIALAALVANRTVERVIDEQQFENDRTSCLDALAARTHDHAFRSRRVASDLQLRHPFDLDQANAAETGRSEFGVIAVDRDFLLDALGGLDQPRALGHRDGHAVDREVDVHAGTVAGTAATRDANCCGKRSSTDFKNGSIESPSAQRFKPVIAPETRSSIS